jgi:hypothetical protein
VVRVVVDVFDTDELEHVVRVRPVLERVLGLRGGGPARDVRRDLDELALPRIAGCDLEEVVRVVERIRGDDLAGTGRGDAEGPQRALVPGTFEEVLAVVMYSWLRFGRASSDGLVNVSSPDTPTIFLRHAGTITWFS